MKMPSKITQGLEAIVPMFFIIGVLKNFANFTGKQLCCSPLFLFVKVTYPQACKKLY